MKKKPTIYYKQALLLMEQLYKTYPSLTLGQHLSTALADYGDFWGITDKEFCFAIEKYMAELSLDEINIAPQAYVDKIIADANLLFEDDMEEEED